MPHLETLPSPGPPSLPALVLISLPRHLRVERRLQGLYRLTARDGLHQVLLPGFDEGEFPPEAPAAVELGALPGAGQRQHLFHHGPEDAFVEDRVEDVQAKAPTFSWDMRRAQIPFRDHSMRVK